MLSLHFPISPFSQHTFLPERARTHSPDPVPYALSFLSWPERSSFEKQTHLFSFMCINKHSRAFVKVNRKLLLSAPIKSRLCPPKDLNFNRISDQPIEATSSTSLTWEKITTAMDYVLCLYSSLEKSKLSFKERIHELYAERKEALQKRLTRTSDSLGHSNLSPLTICKQSSHLHNFSALGVGAPCFNSKIHQNNHVYFPSNEKERRTNRYKNLRCLKVA